MAELIREDDTLNQGRKKLNNAIKAFNETVVEGDSSVEAAQARVDEKGQSHTTLKERIDDGFTKVNTQLAEKVDQVSFNASNQSIEFYANGILIRSVDLSEAGNAQAVQSYIDSLVSDGFIEGVTLANGAVTYEKTGFA